MKILTRLILPFLLSLAAHGCSCDNTSGVGGVCPGDAVSCGQACTTPPDGVDGGLPAGCDVACTSNADCDLGFYCGADGACTADCFSTSDEYCPDGICTTEGRCFVPQADGGSGGDGGGDAGNECAGDVPVTTVTPNVVFLVDQSGSMNADFGGLGDRWDVVKNALIGDDPMGGDVGLIGELEDSVRFGVSLYTFDDADMVANCPYLTNYPPDGGEVDVALGNYSSIEAMYRGEPYLGGGETPTGDSVDNLIAALPAAVLSGSDPTIIILATDGDPDTCEEPNPQNGHQEAIDAVARAYNNHGIPTFAIAVGNAVGDEHMMDIAIAGHSGTTRVADCVRGPGACSETCSSARGAGCQPGEECNSTCDPAWNPPTPVACSDMGASPPCYYRPSAAQLKADIEALVQGQRSCVVDLDNQVLNFTSSCADGTVTLDLGAGAGPQPLGCDDADGFQMLNSGQFELTGSACSDFLNNPNAVIDASFPCGNIIIG